MNGLAERLGRFLEEAPLVTRIVVLWLLVELGAAVIMPVVVPDRLYLRWYLRDGSEAAVQEFLSGDALLLPDADAGWRSAPNRAMASWVTDADGTRVTGSTRWEVTGNVKVLALGSSMVNGGTAVSNQETITAYLEQGSIATKNAGTMLYGLDQMLLAYESRLGDLGASIVLVGLDPDPFAPLRNTYVPLRSPDEANMPFVKPRFMLVGDTIELVEASPRKLLAPGAASDLVSHFESHDGYAYRFTEFEHLGMTPLLTAFRVGLDKVRGLRSRFGDREADMELLERLMRRMAAATSARGATLCYVAMPPALGDWTRFAWEPDLYAERLSRWRDRGACVIDGREALQGAEHQSRDLFGPDGAHLSPMGNRILAEAIIEAFAPLREAAGVPTR